MRSGNLFIASVALLIFIVRHAQTTQVCKSFNDYYYKHSSRCYKNPDTELNATEILRYRWNCTVEEYRLTTDDKYQILVIRAYKDIIHPTPIVLGHGIMMNSLGFLLVYNQSLAYHIIDSGYQIFLINFRGTRYSNHYDGYLTKEKYRYWKFSFQQMAKYDLRKTLKLVKSLTGQKSIYLCYSMGCTIGLAYSSLFSEDSSDKLLGIIAMANAVFFDHSTSVLKKSARALPKITPLIQFFGRGELFSRKEFRSLIDELVSGPEKFEPLFLTLGALLGSDMEGILPEYLPVAFKNLPDSCGVNVALHFSQLMNSGKFRQFDYGVEKNLQKYGTREPPDYNLSKIKVPVAQLIGKGDILTTVQDAKKVNNLLNPDVRYGVKAIKKWTHLDFLYNKDTVRLLVPEILRKIEKMELNVY